MIRFAISGVLSAALMILARIGLSHAGLPHYQSLVLFGRKGLEELGMHIAYGAGYGLIYGWLVRSVLPKGLVVPALIFTLVPLLVETMVLPLWRGGAIISEPWQLFYKTLHFFIFSLGLVFLEGKSSKAKQEG